MLILERPGKGFAATAPTNKSLAQRSKSPDTGKATKRLPRRSDPARPHRRSGPQLRRARRAWRRLRHQPTTGKESDVATLQTLSRIRQARSIEPLRVWPQPLRGRCRLHSQFRSQWNSFESRRTRYRIVLFRQFADATARACPASRRRRAADCGRGAILASRCLGDRRRSLQGCSADWLDRRWDRFRHRRGGDVVAALAKEMS